MREIKINLTRTVRIAYNIVTVFIKPFNRTSMELKLRTATSHLRSFGSFNRTSMELKRLCLLDNTRPIYLLIEPVWN